MPIDFDFEGARKSGATDKDIAGYFKEKYSIDFDIEGAKKNGANDSDILDYLNSKYSEPVKKKEPAISLGYKTTSELLASGALPKQEKPSALKTAATTTPSVSIKRPSLEFTTEKPASTFAVDNKDLALTVGSREDRKQFLGQVRDGILGVVEKYPETYLSQKEKTTLYGEKKIPAGTPNVENISKAVDEYAEKIKKESGRELDDYGKEFILKSVVESLAEKKTVGQAAARVDIDLVKEKKLPMYALTGIKSPKGEVVKESIFNEEIKQAALEKEKVLSNFQKTPNKKLDAEFAPELNTFKAEVKLESDILNNQIQTEYKQEFDAALAPLQQQYQSLVDSRQMTPEQANAEFKQKQQQISGEIQQNLNLKFKPEFDALNNKASLKTKEIQTRYNRKYQAEFDRLQEQQNEKIKAVQKKYEGVVSKEYFDEYSARLGQKIGEVKNENLQKELANFRNLPTKAKLEKALMAGWNDVLSTVGGAIGYTGLDASEINKAALQTGLYNPLPAAAFENMSLRDMLTDSDWWIVNGVRSVPFTVVTMPVGISGGILSGTLAKALGAAKRAQVISSVVGGGVIGWEAERFLETGIAFKEAIDAGKSLGEASEIAASSANLQFATLPLNIAQMLPFFGKGFKFLNSSLLEGFSGGIEEIIQGWAGQRAKNLQEGTEQNGFGQAVNSFGNYFFSKPAMQEGAIGFAVGQTMAVGSMLNTTPDIDKQIQTIMSSLAVGGETQARKVLDLMKKNGAISDVEFTEYNSLIDYTLEGIASTETIPVSDDIKASLVNKYVGIFKARALMTEDENDLASQAAKELIAEKEKEIKEILKGTAPVYLIFPQGSDIPVVSTKEQVEQILLKNPNALDFFDIKSINDQVTQAKIDEAKDLLNKKQQEEETTTDGEGTIEGTISAGTNVLETGVGMAAEPGKEGVAREDIQAEEVLEPAKTSENISTAADSKGVYIKDGEYGFIRTDGQLVVFETNDKIIDLGNKDELAETPISEFGIEKEEILDVQVNEDNSVVVEGVKFVNNFSNPQAAINTDANGNVVSVNLETEDGKKRTIRGQRAEEIAYQYKLKEFEQNATEESIARLEQEVTNLEGKAEKAKSQTKKRSTAKRKSKEVVSEKVTEVTAPAIEVTPTAEKTVTAPKVSEAFKDVESTAKALEDINTFDQQDAKAEIVVGKEKDKWGRSQVWRERIENAGDILRELSGRGKNPDVKYLQEKIDKIKDWILNGGGFNELPKNIKTLKDVDESNVRFSSAVDGKEYLDKFHKDVLQETINAYKGIVVKTQEEQVVKDFILTLLQGDKSSIYSKLREVEDIVGKIKKQGELKSTPLNVSEDYHKAKADGSNPELVAAVEELLGKPTAETTKPSAKAEPTKEAAKTEAKKSKPEQIGEGLLDALGLAPVEPAKKAGKKKPVNVSNKSELSELEGKAQGDKKTIIEAAKKAIATLKSVFPDMEIYIHEDTDSYNETMSDVGGVANSRGNFAFERDANNNPTGRGRIDINLSNAKDTTVAHELVHAVLLKAFGDNPGLFKAFRDRMSTILRTDLNEQVTAFEKLYAGQDVAPEEYLTELAALLSQGGETVEYKPSTLRKVAALINEFVSRITKGKFQPFKSEVDFINFVGFLNQISGAISEGGEIEGTTGKIKEQGNGKGFKSRSQIINKANTVKDIDVKSIRMLSRAGKRVSKGLSVKTVNNQKVVSEAEDLSIDYVKENAPKIYIANANILAEYPIVEGIKKIKNVETIEQAQEVYDIFVRQVANNLKYLIDNFNDEYREISTLWYDGANILAQNFSEKYGVSEEQAAGIIAAMSPQKDWYQNVRLAEMVMMAFKENPTMTTDMIKKQILINTEGLKPSIKKVNEAKKSFELNKTKLNKEKLDSAQKDLEDKAQKGNKIIEYLKGFIGEKMSSVPNEFKCYYTRLWNEVNTTKDYDVLRPDSKVMGVAMNKDGVTKSKVAWGSYTEIGKAVSIHIDGSQENITKTLGEMHKIRNFFNNIIDPMSKDKDVTMDTHAIAAALLMPLSGNTKQVGQNFGTGTSNSSPLGIKGLYYAYAEAYDLAAKEKNLLPRQVQSITWEAVRGLFTDVFKSKVENVKKINEIWSKYTKGEINIDEARNEISEYSGGIKDPTWSGPFQERIGKDVESEGIGTGSDGARRSIVGESAADSGTIKSKAQKAQDARIKEFIDAQRKAGQSDKDIKAGLELVADKVGLTPEDINNLMGVESDEAKPKKGYTPKKKRLEPAQEPEVKEQKERAFATEAERRTGDKTTEIPDSLKFYTPTSEEEQTKIAQDFIKEVGVDEAITYFTIPSKRIEINPQNLPVLASELLDILYAKQASASETEAKQIANNVHDILEATVVAAGNAATLLSMMRKFYNSNPYNFLAQVTRLLELNNKPIADKIGTAIININNINKAVAGEVANNVVKEIVSTRAASAKEKFERSKANLKALWKKSFNIGIASNQYEAAKNDIQFVKALAVMAKDFVVYQSVEFSEFIKEVASQIGLQESDIDQDHLRKIFEKAKSEKIQEGIKVSLKELELKLKDLIESHYSSPNSIADDLVKKLKDQFGLNDTDAKKVEEAIRQEIKVLTAQEKIKALKAEGIKNKKYIDEILALSEQGLLNVNSIIEKLGAKLGIQKLTKEETDKLVELAKQIKEAKEDRIKARNVQKFEDYKFVLSKKFNLSDFLVSNYLTNIFGSLRSNLANIAGNVSETNLLVSEIVTNALLKGNPKDALLGIEALIRGTVRGFDFTKEVLTTGVSSYKELGDIRARGMWELIMDRKVDLTKTERVLQYLLSIPYVGEAALTERRFWNRALLSMDSLSGTTNAELGALWAATKEADNRKLKGQARAKFIAELMAATPELKAEAQMYAAQLGYKPGSSESKRAVTNYLVSKRPAPIKKIASEYSARATLTQQPSPNTLTGMIATAMNNAIGKNQKLKFIFPVVNTFANLIVKNIERSPFEFLSLGLDVLRAQSENKTIGRDVLTQEEVARRIKTATVWTAIAVLLFMAAGGMGDDDEEGLEIYGSGTGNAALDKQRRSLGWKPNTIRFGKDGGYYNFEYLPFGFMLSMVGNMRDYFKYKDESGLAIRKAQSKRLFNKTYDSLTSAEKAKLEAELMSGKYNLPDVENKELANLTWNIFKTPGTYTLQLFKSLGDLIGVMGDKSKWENVASFLGNIGRGVAAPRYGGEIRDITDNKLYDTKEFRNMLAANVPGVTLGNVRLDAFGREIEKYKSESFWSGVKYAFTSRFYNPPTVTPIDQFLWENRIVVNMPDNPPSLAYNDDVFRAYLVKRGDILLNKIWNAMKEKKFQKIDNSGKVVKFTPQQNLEVINKYVSQSNEEAKKFIDELLKKAKKLY